MTRPLHPSCGQRSRQLGPYTIITTTPNAVMEPIHNRMPVIVDPSDYDAWLDPKTSPDTAKELMRPAPDDLLEVYPVSTR